MKVALLKETHPDETRVAMVPSDVSHLVDQGAEVFFEKGLGSGIGINDELYLKAGAKSSDDREELLKESDLFLRLRKPEIDEIELMKPGVIHVSYLDPFNERELIGVLRDKEISSISMEMIPRTTRAQKMDVLSSQASLAGYVAVTLAAEKLNKIFPMMMTPAGTISPSRVFIIGAGVAGLQAIATAKRLGARVEAFDTRPVVEEQVKSLGAKFIKIDLGETGQTKDGYAKALTPEQIELQKQGMAKVCKQSDIVVTTAQLFGRKAPRIIDQSMIEEMLPGSIIVDMAVESGGNVEGSRPGEEVDINGVLVMGHKNLPGRVPIHASQMFSSNVLNFIKEFWDKDSGILNFSLEDEIIQGCLITHKGQIQNETIRDIILKGDK